MAKDKGKSSAKPSPRQLFKSFKAKHYDSVTGNSSTNSADLEEATLCPKCAALDFTKDSGLSVHHADRTVWKEAVNLGCNMCTTLWYALVQMEPDRKQGLFSDSLDQQSSGLHYSISKGSYVAFDTKPGYQKWLYQVGFEIVPKAEVLGLARALSSEPIVGSTDIENTHQKISNWLEACTSHNVCNRDTDRTKLPGRLVHLDTGVALKARLVETSDLEGPINFMALSHCWGLKRIATLSVTNIEEWKQDLPLDLLPLNFQQAMAVTKKLGIRYIWIDSLCIIQDSPGKKDWIVEAAKMLDVYRNAYCTLAATGFEDGQGGIFSQRDSKAVIPFKITKDSQTFHLFNRAVWTTDILKAPLNARAWVFQERLLSPRIIHFGKNQIYWECHEVIASEVLCNGQAFSSYVKNSFGDLVTRTIKPGLKTGSSSTSKINESFRTQPSFLKRPINIEFWLKLIAEYSMTGITFQSDRLIAVGGIANQVQRNLPDHEYVAGLWIRRNKLDDLVHSLAWSTGETRIGAGTTSYNDTSPAAPSWSWASASPKMVSWLGLRDTDKGLLTVLNKEIEYQNENNIFGSVVVGRLRVQGFLQKGIFCKHEPRHNPDHQISYDCTFNTFSGGQIEGNLFLDKPRGSLEDGLSDSATTNTNFGAFLLPIRIATNPHQVNLFTRAEKFIESILLESTESRPGEYRRFGMFETHASNQTGLTSPDRGIDVDMVTEFGEGNRYSITII